VEQIWEGSKYKIKASVVDHSTPYTGKVDLYVLKNHDQSQPIQTEKGISVKAGKPIVRTFDVPKVDPKVANYDFSVIAKYGDAMGKSQQLADAKVWPKEVTIHVTNKLDGDKDFKDVKLLIQQGGKAVAKLVTDASGKCEVELPLKAPYAILARPPYQIIKNVRDAANTRHHEIQAERRIVAKFVKPDVTKSPPWVANAAANTELNRKAAVRLWVNQKSKKADAAEAKGNVIEFEVSADPKDVGKKGDKVFVQVNFSKDSKRNDPKPELLNNPAVTDLNESANKKVYTGYVTLDKDGGTAKFKVNTGLAGGDSCLVSIGGRKSPPFDQSRKFVNWRKLWYELRYPTLLKPKLNKGDYAILLKTAITGKLARTFIVLEKSKSHEFPNANATFAKKNGMIMPKAFFQDGAGSIYVVTNGWLDTTNKFSGDAKTRNQTIYVSLCERAFSSNVQTIAPVQVVKSDDFDLPLPADAYVFKKRPDNGADNVTVAAGHKWKAVIAGAQLHATTWDAGAPSAAGAVAGKVTLAEARRAGKTVTVSFAAKAGGKFDTTLSATETAKVEAFVTDLLSSDPDLRDVGNQVTLHVTSRTADADDAARATAALGVAKAKFDAVAKTVKYHPGLDRNGAPREGAMNVAWVTVKDYVTFNVKLPKSAHGVADYKKILPGDFVGAAESATECPVKVQFSYCSGGEINGNSGSGSQIMVLRAAATADALSETVCHELGHAMGMTIVPGLNNDLLPPGLATQHVDSGKQSYVNGPAPYNFTDGKREIHKGGHCAFNLPAAKRADKRFLGWSPDAATPGCIMWGSGDNVATRANYCDECGKLIKARRLDDIITAFAGRGANDG
jgi:hypothetical protein